MTLPTVALTFDDGPSAWTESLLDVLAAHDAHATFFVLGCHIAGREKVLRRAYADGHELGVHGWDHTPMSALAPDQLAQQLARCSVRLLKAGAPRPRLWRAPWQQTPDWALTTATDCWFDHVGVDLDGRDVSRGEDAIVATVAPALSDGLVVGLHDGIAPNGEQQLQSREGTVCAVARLLPLCRSVTVSELRAR